MIFPCRPFGGGGQDAGLRPAERLSGGAAVLPRSRSEARPGARHSPGAPLRRGCLSPAAPSAGADRTPTVGRRCGSPPEPQSFPGRARRRARVPGFAGARLSDGAAVIPRPRSEARPGARHSPGGSPSAGLPVSCRPFGGGGQDADRSAGGAALRRGRSPSASAPSAGPDAAPTFRPAVRLSGGAAVLPRPRSEARPGPRFRSEPGRGPSPGPRFFPDASAVASGRGRSPRRPFY